MDSVLDIYRLQEGDNFLMFWMKVLLLAGIIFVFFWLLSRLLRYAMITLLPIDTNWGQPVSISTSVPMNTPAPMRTPRSRSTPVTTRWGEPIPSIRAPARETSPTSMVGRAAARLRGQVTTRVEVVTHAYEHTQASNTGHLLPILLGEAEQVWWAGRSPTPDLSALAEPGVRAMVLFPDPAATMLGPRDCLAGERGGLRPGGDLAGAENGRGSARARPG